MSRRNKIDVMASLELEFGHDIGQFFKAADPAGSKLGYVKILTKNTAHVTVTEKNGARSMLADKGRFFSEMRTPGCNDRQISCMTIPCLFQFSVNPAIVRAEYARIYQPVDLFDPFLQDPFIEQPYVGWSPHGFKIYASINTFEN
jgi:hypothetical protein